MKAIKRDEKEGDESESKASLGKLSLLKKSALAAILVIFALALTSGVASATTRVVNQTAPACTASPAGLYYGTIQAAINAASPGDTIIVCPEATAYQETVDVNKSDKHQRVQRDKTGCECKWGKRPRFRHHRPA